jgi:glycosyltransferase involved in cell wall biosynthesis
MSATIPVSLCVITKDASALIEACLASAEFADERVVVDSGSGDDTVEKAGRCGARVIAQPWLGFGAQKNFAVAQARHDWVLCLDADERISAELAASIIAAMANGPVFAAYRMRRRNRFLGRWLAHGEGYPDWNLRLFDRRRARWTQDPVHEHVIADGPVGSVDGDLLHDSADSLDAYLAKQNRYTSLQAAAMHERGEPAPVARMVVSPLVRFIRFYFLRLGFLDGAAGFAHIAIGSFNSMIKYAKLLGLRAARDRS